MLADVTVILFKTHGHKTLKYVS